MENTLTGTAEVLQLIMQVLVEDLRVNVRQDEIPDEYSLLEGG